MCVVLAFLPDAPPASIYFSFKAKLEHNLLILDKNIMNNLKKVPLSILYNTLASVTSNCSKRLQVPSANIQNSVRCFGHSYEGDGKTSANIINMDQSLGLMIHSYSPHGFRLNNDIFIRGSIALFPNSVLSWQVQHIDEITEESLSIFPVLDPGIDIVVIGCGDAEIMTRGKKMHLANLMRKMKLPAEILPTDAACTTFNFLVAENRFVGAVLIPQLKGYNYIKDGLERNVNEHGLLSYQ